MVDLLIYQDKREPFVWNWALILPVKYEIQLYIYFLVYYKARII